MVWAIPAKRLQSTQARSQAPPPGSGQAAQPHNGHGNQVNPQLPAGNINQQQPAQAYQPKTNRELARDQKYKYWCDVNGSGCEKTWPSQCLPNHATAPTASDIG